MVARVGAEERAGYELDLCLEVAERDPVWQEMRELVEHHGYNEAEQAMAEALSEALADYGERIDVTDTAEMLVSQDIDHQDLEADTRPEDISSAEALARLDTSKTLAQWRREAVEAGDGELLTEFAALEAADRMDALVAAYDAAVAKAQD
jgi:hypothetical protein